MKFRNRDESSKLGTRNIKADVLIYRHIFPNLLTLLINFKREGKCSTHHKNFQPLWKAMELTRHLR